MGSGRATRASLRHPMGAALDGGTRTALPGHGGAEPSGGVTRRSYLSLGVRLYRTAPLVFRLHTAGDGSFSALLPLLFTNFHCCESDLELKKKKKKWFYTDGSALPFLCAWRPAGHRAEEPISALRLGRLRLCFPHSYPPGRPRRTHRSRRRVWRAGLWAWPRCDWSPPRKGRARSLRRNAAIGP